MLGRGLPYAIDQVGRGTLGKHTAQGRVAVRLASSPRKPRVSLRLCLPGRMSKGVPIFLNVDFVPGCAVCSSPSLSIPRVASRGVGGESFEKSVSGS